MKWTLFAEKSPGNQQKNGFINKHRQIVPIKDMVGDAASDDTRHCKKYQNSQFSTDAHPRFLLHRSNNFINFPPEARMIMLQKSTGRYPGILPRSPQIDPVH